MPKFSPEGYRAWIGMIATDQMSPDKWLKYVEKLNAEQLQRELLRQATDTKLQLVSILNTLHLALIVMIVLMAMVLWRVW